MISDHTRAARELLAFYADAGVDAAVQEAPVDRFADPGASLAAPRSRADAAPAAERPPVPRNSGESARPPR